MTADAITIERLDGRRRADCEQVADLHVAHLADSPIVQLGPLFLRRFYYGTLVRAHLVEATVARRGPRIVGFISWTRRPDFMSYGFRRWFLRLGALMALSIVRRPALLGELVQTLRVMRARTVDPKSNTRNAGIGEVLSIAVVTDERNAVPEGGSSRVTVRLFEEMVAYFRAINYHSVILLVKPANLPSNLFCSSMGCAFEKVVIAGTLTHRYTYSIPPRTREQPGTVPAAS